MKIWHGEDICSTFSCSVERSKNVVILKLQQQVLQWTAVTMLCCSQAGRHHDREIPNKISLQHCSYSAYQENCPRVCRTNIAYVGTNPPLPTLSWSSRSFHERGGLCSARLERMFCWPPAPAAAAAWHGRAPCPHSSQYNREASRWLRATRQSRLTSLFPTTKYHR